MKKYFIVMIAAIAMVATACGSVEPKSSEINADSSKADSSLIVDTTYADTAIAID